MTIPTDIMLPGVSSDVASDPGKLTQYLRDLTYDLEKMYGELANGVNGRIGNDLDIGSSRYLPTISGGTTSGTGTYTHQTGWLLRQGLIVDVFADIRWSAHTGTGNLLFILPYQIAESSNSPFIGSVAAQNITFTGYLSGVGDPGTRNMEIVDNRSGNTFSNIAITNSDTTLRIHIRYIGKEIER